MSTFIDPVLYPALHPSIFGDTGHYHVHAILPGKGSENMECGKVKFAVACGDHDCSKKPELIYHNCMRITCPVCFRSGAVPRMSSRIQDRLYGMYDAYAKKGKYLGKLKHIVFSPPQDMFTLDDFRVDQGKTIKKKLCAMLKKYSKDGVYGGAVIFHPWRRKHMDGTECDDKHCTRRHQWVFGPHIHYLGYGYFTASDIVHRETGWVYKRIKEKSGKRRAYETVFYLLTHCAVFTKQVPVVDSTSHDIVSGEYKEVTIGQHYSYVGLMSNCKGGERTLEKGTEIVNCETCGSDLHKYGYHNGEVCLDEDMGEYTKPYKIVEWYVNFKKKRKRELF